MKKFTEWMKLKELAAGPMTGTGTTVDPTTVALLKKITSNKNADPNTLAKQIGQLAVQKQKAADVAAAKGDAPATIKSSMDAAKMRRAIAAGME